MPISLLSWPTPPRESSLSSFSRRPERLQEKAPCIPLCLFAVRCVPRFRSLRSSFIAPLCSLFWPLRLWALALCAGSLLESNWIKLSPARYNARTRHLSCPLPDGTRCRFSARLRFCPFGLAVGSHLLAKEPNKPSPERNKPMKSSKAQNK
jgi:hypothetical protein